MTPRVFVISLARSAARRNASRERLARAGLSAEIIDAVDCSTAPGQDSQVAPLLTSRERACLASHSRVYERILQEGLPAACILEDDCLLSPSFPRALEYAAREPREWDALLLGHHSSRHAPAVGAETCYRTLARGEGFRVARVAEFPMGAYAYVVTGRGARALLAYAQPPRMPADWVVGYSPAAGVRLCAVVPPCVIPDPDVETTIDDRRHGGAGPDRPPAWRRWIGRAALQIRKTGFRPYGYASRAGGRMRP